MKAVLLIAFAITTTAHADEGKWHLMTQSEGGTVSLISGLTKEACEKMRYDLQPYVQHCGNPPVTGCSWTVLPGDIKTSQCFE